MVYQLVVRTGSRDNGVERPRPKLSGIPPARQAALGTPWSKAFPGFGDSRVCTSLEILSLDDVGVLAVELQTGGSLRIRTDLLAEQLPEFSRKVHETRTLTQLKTEPLQFDGVLHVLNPCHMARRGTVVGMCFTPRLQQAAPGKHEARVAAGFAATADLTVRLATKGAFDCRLG